jgi:gliding motility-associated lipoprotein GldH
MKKGFKNLSFIFFAAILFSCSDKTQQEQIHVFPEATWHRFDILNFELPVRKTTDEHTIQAIVRVTEEFSHQRIPLHFIMTYPSGEERIWEQTLPVRDGDGNHLGIKKDGIYEIVLPVRTRVLFREPGNCNITAEQIIPKYNTHGIISFGLRLVRN